jgi:hypothetical protein
MKASTRIAAGATTIALCGAAAGAAVIDNENPVAAGPAVRAWPAPATFTTVMQRRTRGGDFNGDGKDDLITPESRYPRSLGTFIGMSILFGSDQGLGARVRFSSPCTEEIRDIAAGDINGDGRADIAVGCDYKPGRLAVMPGTVRGIDTARAAFFELRTVGMVGLPAGTPDWFGAAATIGDFDGDGRGDVGIAAHPNQGDRLVIFPGTATGPTTKGSMMITRSQLDTNRGHHFELGGGLLH